ncbi:DUF6002 family protein [Streptomyces sp. NPDC006134]|uniref:DUF6002 family protein n=1 Tax=Streptomyces sp. NPDC006134 TaxID=3154467 RepID=UPI0033CB1335
MSANSVERTAVVTNALSRHYDVVAEAARIMGRQSAVPEGEFEPGFELPELSTEMEQYFAASDVALGELGEYRGRRLTLLDMMRNPHTRTTKTFASLVMVARAVHHIQTTGERILILTPSSANKATALRDAVWRAIDAGLVTRDQLRIAVIVPTASQPKLWSSPLSTDPDLRRRNPVMVYDGPERASVKDLARAFMDKYASVIEEDCTLKIWYTLNIANYKVADAVRAAVEDEFFTGADSGSRLHAHSVSSAYGLLGHHAGHRLLGDLRERPATEAPRYLLVQHLDTPDMVLHLRNGSFSRDNIPPYTYDPVTGLHHQETDPHFPFTTADPDETLETTFYTHTPVTSDEMTSIIRTNGGDGIVVSLHECITRYPQIRTMLARAGVQLPADLRALREWSLVMALTGVLNAIDRDLVAPGEDILVHGSGCYAQQDYRTLSRAELTEVYDVETACDVIRTAVSA